MKKVLVANKINTVGRLANQLFYLSSLYGLAINTNREFQVPKWKYREYFDWDDNIKQSHYPTLQGTKEPFFHYCGSMMEQELIKGANIMSLEGYFQTEKYFAENKQDILRILSWKEDFVAKLKDRNKGLFDRPTIGIHVRRGDYVGNSNYHNLPAQYYVLALEKFFPKWDRNYNIAVFSDDLQWCKTYLNGNNIYFMEGNTDIEDLCLLSQCQNFILSNSSYSWWAAYLSKTKGIVVRPTQLFEGELKKSHNTKDFWREDWIPYNYEGQKIDLQDVTFTIPVYRDHLDRDVNIGRVVRYLNKHLDTNILIGEQGGEYYKGENGYKYVNFKNMHMFHRTKMLNEMANMATTPIVVNYDADVLIPIIQLVQAAKLCRSGIGMVFPYDGRFARIPKPIQGLELHAINTTNLLGSRPSDPQSVGGAVFFRKDEFIKGGMENEYFISYGPEDVERAERMGRVGVDIRRIKGPLFHYDHHSGVNSTPSNPYFHRNCEELTKIRTFTNQRLKEYIKTWPWLK